MFVYRLCLLQCNFSLMYSREVIDVTHDCRNLHIGFFSDTKVDLSDFSTYSFCWALHIYFCSYDLDITSKLQNCRKCSFASFSLWVGLNIWSSSSVVWLLRVLFMTCMHIYKGEKLCDLDCCKRYSWAIEDSHFLLSWMWVDWALTFLSMPSLTNLVV